MQVSSSLIYLLVVSHTTFHLGVFRVEVATAFFEAGIPHNKLNQFREVLKEHGYKLVIAVVCTIAYCLCLQMSKSTL